MEGFMHQERVNGQENLQQFNDTLLDATASVVWNKGKQSILTKETEYARTLIVGGPNGTLLEKHRALSRNLEFSRVRLRASAASF